MIEANGKLIIAEYGNFRALVWNSIPSATGTAADVAIGQASLTAATAAATATGMGRPFNMNYNNGRLWITDVTNNRILGYNGIPTSNGATADWIVGQNGNTNALVNRYGISGVTLSAANSITYDGTYYWIADTENQRVVRVELP